MSTYKRKELGAYLEYTEDDIWDDVYSVLEDMNLKHYETRSVDWTDDTKTKFIVKFAVANGTHPASLPVVYTPQEFDETFREEFEGVENNSLYTVATVFVNLDDLEESDIYEVDGDIIPAWIIAEIIAFFKPNLYASQNKSFKARLPGEAEDFAIYGEPNSKERWEFLIESGASNTLPWVFWSDELRDAYDLWQEGMRAEIDWKRKEGGELIDKYLKRDRDIILDAPEQDGRVLTRYDIRPDGKPEYAFNEQYFLRHKLSKSFKAAPDPEDMGSYKEAVIEWAKDFFERFREEVKLSGYSLHMPSYESPRDYGWRILFDGFLDEEISGDERKQEKKGAELIDAAIEKSIESLGKRYVYGKIRTTYNPRDKSVVSGFSVVLEPVVLDTDGYWE